MIITALYTGMRIGEIMALEWSDIDFKNKLIKITKSYSYTEDRIKDPKTESSKRVIRVSQKLLDILKQLRINHQKFIFMSPQGKVPTANAANKVLRKQLKKLGIKKDHFHFHSLRHTHVALLLFKGVPLYAISKRLGHSNMSITASVYAYMLDELRQKSDDQIEEILDSI
jgi:integrase